MPTSSTRPHGVPHSGVEAHRLTPEFLDFTIKDPDSWRKAKARMPSRRPDPVGAAGLTLPHLAQRGHWIEAGLWFGFDVTFILDRWHGAPADGLDRRPRVVR